MPKLSEETKALRALQRKQKRAIETKRKKETLSAIHAQKCRRKKKCKNH